MKPLLALAACVAVGFGTLAPGHAMTWPQQIPSPSGTVTLYQPQIDSFTGNQLTAHAAVSVTPSGGAPTFGAVFFDATLATDRGTGLATIQDLKVTQSRFPSGAPGTADAVNLALSQAAAAHTLTWSQSQLLAQLALTQKEQAAAADLNNTPPQILFATQPTVLVTIDGEPKLTAASDSSLMVVVNSPFFITLDPTTKTYYLQGGGQWLSASDILNGPWQPATDVPDAVTRLAAAQPNNPSGDQTSAAPAGGPAPQIIVATQPTELIQTSGPAEYGPIDGTDLLYVTNTESDVFMDIDNQALYVLLSGRWFTAANQAGPWTFVPPAQLPGDFARIPQGLPVSNVLASIPGTQPAQAAVLGSQVPQTAAIQRSAAGPKVSYDGEPKFQPVADNSAAQYAVNTSHAVVKVENTYYVCSEGVWFQGPAPVGPWVVSVAVPDVIYTIPPTCPIYPVTYCRIYSSTPDVVYCGYLPGYTGSFVYGGALVYGTGWSYPAWFGTEFIPRPVTWGFGATFSFGAGTWGFGLGAGWGATSFGVGWNSGWWGVGNYHWSNWNWNSNWQQNINVTRNVTNNINVTNTYNRTVNNLYRNNPERLTPSERQRLEANERSLAQRQDQLRNQIARDQDRAGTAAEQQRSADQRQERRDEAQREADRRQLEENRDDIGGRAAAREEPVRGDRDNVFADRDGNVYRHDGNDWQQRADDRWRQPDRANFERHRADLNRNFAARVRGGGERRR